MPICLFLSSLEGLSNDKVVFHTQKEIRAYGYGTLHAGQETAPLREELHSLAHKTKSEIDGLNRQIHLMQLNPYLEQDQRIHLMHLVTRRDSFLEVGGMLNHLLSLSAQSDKHIHKRLTKAEQSIAELDRRELESLRRGEADRKLAEQAVNRAILEQALAYYRNPARMEDD